MPKQDFLLEYKNYFGRAGQYARVRVFDVELPGVKRVVVVEQPKHVNGERYQGLSVTNGFELICAELVKRGVPHYHTLYVEFWPNEARSVENSGDGFTEVLFEKWETRRLRGVEPAMLVPTGISWRRMEREDVEGLIGGRL